MGLCKLKTQQNFHQSLQLLHFTKHVSANCLRFTAALVFWFSFESHSIIVACSVHTAVFSNDRHDVLYLLCTKQNTMIASSLQPQHTAT